MYSQSYPWIWPCFSSHLLLGIFNSSLRSKHFCGVWKQRKTEEQDFQCFVCAENGARATKKKEGVGRGERRKCLQTNPWILKTSVRQRTGLVIGWASPILLTCVDLRYFSGAPARRGRASRAPFLRNFGKPIKPRKFGYDVTVRASERTPSVQTLGEGERSLGVAQTGEPRNAIFFWRDF